MKAVPVARSPIVPAASTKEDEEVRDECAENDVHGKALGEDRDRSMDGQDRRLPVVEPDVLRTEADVRRVHLQ